MREGKRGKMKEKELKRGVDKRQIFQVLHVVFPLTLFFPFLHMYFRTALDGILRAYVSL